jgi:hypothetical protein
MGEGKGKTQISIRVPDDGAGWKAPSKCGDHAAD